MMLGNHGRAEIKQVLTMFSHLPAGVIVFEKGEIVYYNRHIEEVLSLEDLPKEDVALFIGLILGMKESTEARIREFFLTNSFFRYDDKVIQIDHNAFETMDIFAFCRIEPQILTAAAQKSFSNQNFFTPCIRQTSKDEADEWVRWFGRIEGGKIKTMLTYQGLPLRAEAYIFAPDKNRVVLYLTPKQCVAAAEGDEIAIAINSSADRPGLIGTIDAVDLKARLIYIRDIKKEEHSPLNRKLIRLQPKEKGVISFSVRNHPVVLPIYDLSQSACSVRTKDAGVLRTVKAMGKWHFDGDMAFLGKKIPVRITFFDLRLHSTGAYSIIFDMEIAPEVVKTLKEHLRIRQIELIREVHAKVEAAYPGRTFEAFGD
jgi:hypothetical protein